MARLITVYLMSSKKKPRPLFEVPVEIGSHLDSGWVYRSGVTHDEPYVEPMPINTIGVGQLMAFTGVAYLLTRSHGVVAFRLRDGTFLWSDEHRLTPKDQNPQMSLVWADQKNGIACGLNAVGELIFARFGEKGFEELHRGAIIGKTWAHPAFTDNMVFARSDTEIVAWRLW